MSAHHSSWLLSLFERFHGLLTGLVAAVVVAGGFGAASHLAEPEPAYRDEEATPADAAPFPEGPTPAAPQFEPVEVRTEPAHPEPASPIRCLFAPWRGDASCCDPIRLREAPLRLRELPFVEPREVATRLEGREYPVEIVDPAPEDEPFLVVDPPFEEPRLVPLPVAVAPCEAHVEPVTPEERLVERRTFIVTEERYVLPDGSERVVQHRQPYLHCDFCGDAVRVVETPHSRVEMPQPILVESHDAAGSWS